jgi:hypothetical protein
MYIETPGNDSPDLRSVILPDKIVLLDAKLFEIAAIATTIMSITVFILF